MTALEALRTLVIIRPVAFGSSIAETAGSHVPRDGRTRADTCGRLAHEPAPAGAALAVPAALGVPQAEVAGRLAAPQTLQRRVRTPTRFRRRHVCGVTGGVRTRQVRAGEVRSSH